MKNTFTRFSALIIMMCLSASVFGQGITSASINGSVADANESLIGANIMAVHLPTGTVYGNSTNVDGLFRIPNMRVGGPYTISISYTGYNDFIKENVYLQLGQSYRINAVMKEDAVTLEGVEVVSSRSDIFDGNRTGAETNISEDQIAVLPTVSRAIGDFARVTPQATIREGNDGFSISLNGQNNRYNAIYLDGAVSNDVFGLAGSGTNGGQTGVSPISVDAIESFQIALAPFDVRLGGFSGGAINAVTRSGSNNVEASIYSFFRNEKLAGLTPTDNDNIERVRLDDFTGRTNGFRIGGPIIKDKLFYFVNAELQRDETPLPFDFEDYDGNSSREDLDSLVTKIRSLGYDPGGYENNRGFLDSEKITARLDYNINQNHKASLRYGYVKATNLERLQSNGSNINFQNRAEYFESTTNNFAFELNSVFGVTMANNLKIGFTQVRDDRDPFEGAGVPEGSSSSRNYFPSVQIRDGGRNSIFFGSEPFSTANQLDQDIFTITNNFEIYKGRHNITLGTHNEFYNVYNLFISRAYGDYRYNNLQDFLTDAPSNRYRYNYSLTDEVIGDGSNAGVRFNAGQFGLYVQDEFQASNNFKLTVGVRADLPFYGDTPTNSALNDSLAVFEAAGYDMRGAQSGAFINPRVTISPRIGFNWDISGDRSTQLRGGIGVFTSRAPLVWVGGAYNNNGLSQGSIQTFSSEVFNPDWENQIIRDVSQGRQNIDLFAADFKLPQFLKVNLALDQKLPWGLVANVDLLFNKTLQDVAYQNVNLTEPEGQLQDSPDTRNIYDGGAIIGDYFGVYLGYNTQEGYAYNGSVSLTKPFDNGFQGTVAYSYGDSYKVFDGTSSQNSSQWRGFHSIQGRNIDQQLTRSNFSQGGRFIASASYALPWNKEGNIKTTFSIFHESVQGQSYSYTYANGDDLKGEAFRARELIWIPTDVDANGDGIGDQINLVDLLDDDGNLLKTAAQQWSDLNDFIEKDEYLSENRGGYAERNASRAPWQNVLDFKVLQDFTIKTGEKTHTLQLSLDVFNFTNLLNKNWGRRRFVPSDFELITFEDFADNPNTEEVESLRPTFTFDGVDGNDPSNQFLDDSGIQSSRWQMQVGVRYLFK